MHEFKLHRVIYSLPRFEEEFKILLKNIITLKMLFCAKNMKRHGMLVGKFEFNSYERLMWTLPELIIPLKDAT